MGQYVKYDKLMVQTFQDNLTGPALTWYAQLDLNEVDTWDRLARAFFDQYKFHLEIAPSVWDLSGMKKKKDESSKEYAQQWRATAARVTTHLPEKDLTFTFINTLEEPFFSHLVGHTTTSFLEVVVAGCRIENAIAVGKLQTDKKSLIMRGTGYKPKEPTVSVFNTSNFARPQFTSPTNTSMQVRPASPNQ